MIPPSPTPDYWPPPVLALILWASLEVLILAIIATIIKAWRSR